MNKNEHLNSTLTKYQELTSKVKHPIPVNTDKEFDTLLKCVARK